MKKAIKVIFSVVFVASLFGLAGCSDEQVEKWDKAADAVGDAAKETAKDVKEGVQEVARNAKPTDPDTGEIAK